MKDLLYTHWKKYNNFIDYFFIDYGLRLFYDRSAAFRQEVGKDTIYTKKMYVLLHSLNKTYDAEVMKDIEANAMFSKLSWKVQLNPSINGKQTFYGHIISENE